MSNPSPLHDAVWVRQLADDLKARGHPVKRLLAEAGLEIRALNAERPRIAYEKHAAFFELAAEATGDDCLGLHFAVTRDVRDAGLLGYVGLSSPTVEDYFNNLSKYRQVFSDAIEIDVSDLESRGRLRWRFRLPVSHRSVQALEFAAVSQINSLRAMTARKLTPVSLSLHHSRTRNVKEFERFFGCPVHFGGGENMIEFRLQDLQAPILTEDSRLLTVLRAHCEEVLARHAARAPSLEEKIERLIADRLTKGDAKLEVIAAELGMSARTLSRRLGALELSFNEILDRLRNELAVKYLSDSDLAITEIAFLLGYTEISTFSHAFKRWTGTSPAAFRRASAAR